MNEPQWCDTRRHFCTCEERCEDWPRAMSARPRPSTMDCDHCRKTGEVYESFPMCRECCDVVCKDCGTDYDEETGRITCKRCSPDPRLCEAAKDTICQQGCSEDECRA